MNKLIILLAVFAGLIFSCNPSKTLPAEITITDVYLKLVELNNKAVGPADYTNEPNLTLGSADKKAAGSGGCNRFFSTYELSEKNKIVFSAIGATKMACSKMQIESEFFNALKNTRTYSGENNSVLFSDSTGTVVARFEKAVK